MTITDADASDIDNDKYISERERERNVLFNDALDTFYLRLYGVRHMVISLLPYAK